MTSRGGAFLSIFVEVEPNYLPGEGAFFQLEVWEEQRKDEWNAG